MGLYRGFDLGIFWWVCDLVLDGYGLWWAGGGGFASGSNGGGFFSLAVVGGGEWMWWLWVDVDVEVSFCCDFFFSFFC